MANCVASNAEMINCYATPHPYSQTLCRFFAEGAKGNVVPPHDLLPGPAMVYGILRGCDRIIRQCEWLERDYFHVDHGYFKRGSLETNPGYYRVTRNALQFVGRGTDPRRFEALNIRPKPWRKTGNSILLIPLTGATAQFHNINPHEWLSAVTQEIQRHTDRQIIIKPKTQGDLKDYLDDAWCVVTHTSNVAIDALVAGVPVVALGPSSSRPISWRLENIECPFWPDREPVFWGLADNQFTIDEIRRGEML